MSANAQGIEMLLVEELDRLEPDQGAAALAPLFEGAPRFVARLVAARPFGSSDGLFARAREIAHWMPEDEQIELVDAHPRLGAPPGSVSAFSYREQGFDVEAADVAAEDERRQIGSELTRLNVVYEQRFGFRFCIFVAGRSRAQLLPVLREALKAERGSELVRAVAAAIDIAQDRYLGASGR
jgi:2-oxo-4-hydroxy-4-carboxy--5-ureidoimidazoline (OHCU) decarboxylase